MGNPGFAEGLALVGLLLAMTMLVVECYTTFPMWRAVVRLVGDWLAKVAGTMDDRTFISYWVHRSWQVGPWRVTVEVRKGKDAYGKQVNFGRFGGGWNWVVGFQLGPSSLILNWLVGSTRFTYKPLGHKTAELPRGPVDFPVVKMNDGAAHLDGLVVRTTGEHAIPITHGTLLVNGLPVGTVAGGELTVVKRQEVK